MQGGLCHGLLRPVARAGVWIHARCGDAAAQDGERGLLAGDLMQHIRQAVNPPDHNGRRAVNPADQHIRDAVKPLE